MAASLLVAEIADAQECSAFAAGGPTCSGEPVGSVPGGSDTDRFVGNPIDVVTGNKYQYREDYRAFGSRLAFSRHYNTAQTDIDLGLGRGWRHDYDVSLARIDDTSIRVFQSDGRQIDFVAAGIDAALEAGIPTEELSTAAVPHLPANARDGYLMLGDTATWRMPDGRRLSFTGRYLVQIDWPDGDELRLAYRGGRLASVTDRHDRFLRLGYTAGRMGLDSYEPLSDVPLPGHLERVTMPNGEVLEYRYDERRNLTRVDYRGEPIERMTYGDARFRSHLTELEADGASKAWHYDDEGRGDGYADGYGSVLMLEYEIHGEMETGNTTGRTVVTRTDGAWLDYAWSADGAGVGVVDSIVEHGCETCSGVPRAIRSGRLQPIVQPIDEPANEGRTAIAGLTVSTIGADTATVSAAGLTGPLSVRFDRRARPMQAEPAASSPDADAVRETLRLLDRTSTVDQSGTAYVTRRKTSCSIGAFRTCPELMHDQQMAILATCVYEAPPCGGKDIGPWEVVPYNELGSPRMERGDFVETNRKGEEAGFYARPYRNKTTGELTVAFRGTEPDWRDIVADGVQFAHGQSEQYKRAQLLAESIRDSGNAPVTYTGHSLGGGLATTAAASSGQDAITFNPAALTPETAHELSIDYSVAQATAVNYVVPGELVTAVHDVPLLHLNRFSRPGPRFGSTPAPGQRYEMQPPEESVVQASMFRMPGLIRNYPLYWHGARWLERAATLHTSGPVLSSMEQTIANQCSTPTP